MFKPRKRLSFITLALGAAFAFGGVPIFSPISSAAVLYSSLTPSTPPVVVSIGASVTSGIGDDYNVGAGNINLSGLSFYGAIGTAPAGDSQDQLNIDFYNTSGTEEATLNPSIAGFTTLGLHTLQPGDFIQGGSGGASYVTVPGMGYIIFAPVSYSSFNINTNISTPADPNPTFQLGFGESTTVGSNNAALAAEANGAGTLSMGVYAPGTGTAQVAAFSLSDSSAAVPEPISLALSVPALIAIGCRRRSRTDM